MEPSVQDLQRRLNTVHELHEKAQKKIVELIGCPDYTRRLRSKVECNEKMTPLVHAYEAELRTKDEEIHALEEQLAAIRPDEDVPPAHNVVTARLREVEAKLRQANADNDELMLAQESMQRKMASLETEFRSKVEENQKLVAELRVHNSSTDGESTDLKETVARLRESLRIAEDQTRQATEENEELRSKVASLRRRDDEERAEHEGRKIQLHLADRENDDKVQELENLRNKMAVALKQASANHQTHLKLVEEKHRATIESMREEIRAQEATALKLRAQLSRIDVSSKALTESPASAVEAQARQALELDVRRLYSELTSAQVQRDDAVFRYEQLQASRKNELDDRLREARRDADGLRNRCRDMEETNSRLQMSSDRLADQLRAKTDELRTLQYEKEKVTTELSQALQKSEEAARMQRDLEDQLEAVASEKKLEVEKERRLSRTQERRADETIADQRRMKEDFEAELRELHRVNDDIKAKLREALNKHVSLQAELNDKTRQVEALSTKSERLNTAIIAHKEQLSTCDQRILEMSEREAALVKDLRQLTLQVEHHRIEIVRCERDRDRRTQEVTLLSQKLQSIQSTTTKIARTARR